MSLVYTRTDSGLEVASYAADEAAVARALKDYDPELRLAPQPSDGYGCTVYKVFRWQGNDRPAVFLFAWVDEHGNPYPLSMQLLELVKRHDRNTRNRALDADVLNAQKKAREAAQWEKDVEARRTYWDTPHGRPVLPRSQSLRMARDKRRAEGEKC